METMNSETIAFARSLGQRLVSFERCEDSKAYRNQDPTRIIRLHPATLTPLRVVYDLDNVRQHNEYVSSLGRSGRKFE